MSGNKKDNSNQSAPARQLTGWRKWLYRLLAMTVVPAFLLAALATGLAWASGATAAAADTKAPPATKAIPEKKAAISTGFGNIPSVFVLPTSVRDGRAPGAAILLEHKENFFVRMSSTEKMNNT